ncbi:MAG TPA: T9SS type A sorting domain-containing protein, partial [Flavipsychrobacter sp.]|nr:T9SS type A sorting domain-containing protein [Flavipsychrobacter sp.]
LLNWQVSQSSDAGLFEIEHGTDGANFTKIGEVSAVANKTGYSNIHRGLAEGRNYYRLKVTDENGKSAYSKIAVVVTKGMVVDVISLAPNPVTGVSVVTVSADGANSAEVRVLDAVGRVLLSSKHSLAQGMNNISLDMSSLAQGNYTLQVITDAGNSTPVKFTKL